MHVSCYNMMTCKEGNCALARLGLRQCECRAVEVWEGGTFILRHSMEQLAWCECALRLNSQFHSSFSFGGEDKAF